MKRRHFLATTAAASLSVAEAKSKTRRPVAVIGHTGRGNFGHGLDTVWLKFPETEIVGVADADRAGLKKACAKLKVPETLGFPNYRVMLEKIDAEFVAICPRHVDQHRDMCLAAIEAGARGIYIEKPFLRTPAECDEVINAAKKAGTKIAVAHRNRYYPALNKIDEIIAEKLGKLLEIRGRGKGDRRGGGEDLWVLGTHVLNLIEYFGGAPETCSATLLQDGKPVTKADVKDGAEGLGPLAGNELHARYVLSKGVIATFDSIANDGTGGAGFGLQIIGSEGVINLQCDKNPLAHFIAGNPFKPDKKPRVWEPIIADETATAEAQNHVAPVRDLIACVDDPARQPLCDSWAGAMTVEMVCAVFESHRQGGKAVSFPLEQRDNALSLF